MTNKEILQANLLDIIFENRNKEYGAYALRNGYDKRLLKALGIGLGLVLLLVLVNFLKIANAEPTVNRGGNEGATIKTIELIPEKIIEPEKQKPVEKPVAQVDHQPPVVVPDKEVIDPLPTNEEVDAAAVSNQNVSGGADDKPRSKDLTGEGTGNTVPVEPAIVEPSIKIREQAPEYPGGVAALIEFMKRNLVTPGDLDIGDKKTVKVKFVVGKDGVISDIVIIESPGKDYDREVSRVVKKMPRWKPGIQNDIIVAVAYVMPVTFMGVEE